MGCSPGKVGSQSSDDFDVETAVNEAICAKYSARFRQKTKRQRPGTFPSEGYQMWDLPRPWDPPGARGEAMGSAWGVPMSSTLNLDN